MMDVIMPVYNGGRLLSTAVRSTLFAMREGDRLHIYDDGSEDGETHRVWSALSRRDRDRVSITHSEVRRGVSTALNELLAVTTQKYVARMDADDICFPWRFRRQVAAARDHSVDAIFGAAVVVDSNSIPRRSDPTAISASAMPFHLMFGNVLLHPTASFVSDASLAGRYSMVGAEDYERWLRDVTAGQRFMRIGTPIIAYRVHAAQLSSGADIANEWARQPAMLHAHQKLCRTFAGVGCSDTLSTFLISRTGGDLVSVPEFEDLSAAIAGAASRLSAMSSALLNARVRRARHQLASIHK